MHDAESPQARLSFCLGASSPLNGSGRVHLRLELFSPSPSIEAKLEDKLWARTTSSANAPEDSAVLGSIVLLQIPCSAHH